MNVDYLYEFTILAETNNFQIAADKLYISQSSLSKHIKVMEKELGVMLFDRTTRNVKLSKFGRLLLPYADEIVKLQDDFVNVINKEKNKITIASTTQMYQYDISDILIQYKLDHPSVFFDLIVQSYRGQKNLLIQQETDFIFTSESIEETIEDDFERIFFKKERLVAMLPKDHPFCTSTTISIDKLKDFQFIIQDKKSVEHYLFLNLCNSYGFKPNILTIPIGETLVNFVAKGAGVAIMLSVPAQNVLIPEKVCLKEIESSPNIEMNLLYLKKADLSTNAKNFLQYVKDHQENN